MKKKMALRSSALAVVVASIIAIGGVAPAYAASAGISPNTQSRPSGSNFSWNFSWSGAQSTGSATLSLGDGSSPSMYNGVSGSINKVKQWLSCSPPVVRHQSLTVFGGGGASASSTATITAGGFC